VEAGPDFIAECFWSGVTDADLDRLDERVRSEVEAAQGLEYLGSTLVPEDEVVFCFFAAGSAETVREVAARAEIPFARIVATRHFVPLGDRGSR
jgi:hypothetical protein